MHASAQNRVTVVLRKSRSRDLQESCLVLHAIRQTETCPYIESSSLVYSPIRMDAVIP
jgi:hypothetical protein